MVIIALISDIKTYRIKNAIIVFFLIGGLLTSYISYGLQGLQASALAALLPVPLLFLFFALRMLGAGDIKLFSAIGAIGGVKLVLYSMAYSFIAGGAIALIVMLVNRNFRERWRYLADYIKSCILTRLIQPYSDFGNKKDGSKFRFSYAVACGVIITVIVNYL